MAYQWKVKQLVPILKKLLKQNPNAELEISLQDGNSTSRCSDIINVRIANNIFKKPELLIEINVTSYDF